METLFSAGEEVEKERLGDKATGRQGERDTAFFLRRPVSVYFALAGYSRSNTNSRMISVRATTEVFAAK